MNTAPWTDRRNALRIECVRVIAIVMALSLGLAPLAPAQAKTELKLNAADPLTNVAPEIVPAPADAEIVPLKFHCQGYEGPCVAVPRATDEIWVISDRCLPCCCGAENYAPGLKFSQYDGKCWQSSSLETFLASDLPTTIYIHGNRLSHGEACSSGWQIYCSLARRAPADHPIRFVIWSWPSEKMRCRPVIDTRIKAARADCSAVYLAWLVDRIDPATPVCLIGYSFGSRIATGALHLLAGGAFGSSHLSARLHPQRDPLNAVLVASAVDCGVLLPGHCHGLAMSQVDDMLLVNNCCDRALKWYHVISPGRGGPSALGLTGLYVGGLEPQDQDKVAQINACPYVGARHDWELYFGSPYLLKRMRPYAFFIETP